MEWSIGTHTTFLYISTHTTTQRPPRPPSKPQICDFGLARGIHGPDAGKAGDKDKECDLAAADAAAPEKPKDML